MKLELKRFSGQSDTTLGLLFLDGDFVTLKLATFDKSCSEGFLVIFIIPY